MWQRLRDLFGLGVGEVAVVQGVCDRALVMLLPGTALPIVAVHSQHRARLGRVG